MNSKIALFDPALKDQKGNLSYNLGDVIIHESVSLVLQELFPNDEIVRISTHSNIESWQRKIIKESKFAFVGGSNLLSSNLKQYNQWKVSNSRWYYYFPNLSNLILLGVGWWQYQNKPTFTTRYFYNSVLSHKKLHSVRDGYTLDKMKSMGIANTLNTSCITTWNLNNLIVNRRNQNNNDCLFTLTDYNRSIDLDSKLIKLLLEYYPGNLYFFPQGSLDEEYIRSLELFKNNSTRINIINRSNAAFNGMLSPSIDYIGTRLHGGVKCLQNSMNSLIVAVDNRAIEIGKDINLPVVKRDDFESMKSWLQGKEIFSNINLPLEAISKWKQQFN